MADTGLDVQNRKWFEPARGSVYVAVVFFVGVYLTFACWPLRLLLVAGGAYEHGLAGRLWTVEPGIFFVLGFIFLGPTLVLNAGLALYIRRRREFSLVCGVWLAGILEVVLGLCMIGVQDHSQERFLDGLHDRVKAQNIDYASIRNWLATSAPKETPPFGVLPSTWPSEIRRLQPSYVRLIRPDTVLLQWDERHDWWSLTIGPSKLSPGIADRVRTRQIEPGVSVERGYE